MSIELEAQIRAIADEAFAQTDTVDIAGSTGVAASPTEHPNSNEEYIMLSPNTDTSQQVPRRTKMFAIAASVIVVIAGAIAIAFWQDGSHEPAPIDQPTPSSTISSTTTVDTAALEAVGEQLVNAFGNNDPDTVAALVADDAEPINMFGASTEAELLALFGWIDASDWRFELQQCEGRAPNQAQCTVLQSNAWASAAGAEPVEGTLFMTIDNGQVIALRYGQDLAFTQYFEGFYQFVRETDRAAFDQMWATESDGRTIWPVLNDRSYELFEQYTEQYVESQAE